MAPKPPKIPIRNPRIPLVRVVHIEGGQVIDSAAKKPQPAPFHRPGQHSAPTHRSPSERPASRGNRPPKPAGYRKMPHMPTKSLSDRKFLAKEGALSGHEALEVGGTNGKMERDTVYWVPLGGLEEVGRNCSFFEYNDEIVIIDMGIQFPEEETPGIDWIIPNVSYLEKRKDKIKGIIITHAHYDHFGAVPYVLEKLGNPTIYGTALIREVLKKRLDEMPNVPKMKFHEIKNHDRVKLSEHFTAEFFGVAHTVPDTTGVMLETPAGKMVHFADFRLEYDKHDKVFNLKEFEWLGTQGVHSLLIDSTNANENGHTVSEELVVENLTKVFLEAEGRIILSTFASMIDRISEIIKICERIGRKVIINGRSMKDNFEISKQLGYFKFQPGTVIPIEEMHKYKDNQILLLTPGSQGQENSGLMRIVNGEHKFVTIKPGDTVVLSASVIPGNERSVQAIKDNFVRQGAEVKTNNDLDIHSSGHAPGPDLALVAKLCKPKFIVPVHGYLFQRSANIHNMKTVGIGTERVKLVDNGQVCQVTKDGFEITKHAIDSFYVMVDGLGVGDVEAVVLRDRRLLAKEGMVVIIATVDRKTGKLMKNPDIISRGFIYLKDNTTLIDEMRGKIRNLLNQGQIKQDAEADYIKAVIRDQIGLFLYTRTQRRPMVLPVIIEV